MKHFLLSLALLLPQLAFAQGSPSREIVITADAWGYAAPDTALVTVLVETTGKTAVQTKESADVIEKKLRESLQTTFAESVTVSTRDEKYSGASPGSPISGVAIVRLKRYVGVETGKPETVAAIIDTALQQGASEVTAVELSIRQADKATAKTIEAATIKAREKATLMANSLGVRLGKLIEVNVTEEPAGKLLRLDQQRGQTLALSDQNIHVYVNARFSVE